MYDMLKNWWPVIVLTAVGGGVIGWRNRPTAVGSPAIVLEPPEVRLVEDPLEGDEVKINLQLRNTSSAPVVVKTATTSCGCIGLATRDGDLRKAPIRLSPGQSIPWLVTIRTLNRIGNQSFNIRLDYEAGGVPGHVESTTRLNVLAGWSKEPYMLSFEDIDIGREVTGEVDIYDAIPDPGIPIETILSSDPKHLRAELVAAAGDEARKAELFGADSQLKMRYVLRAHLNPGEETAGELCEAAVTIVPKDPKRPNLYIPVLYRTRAPAYTLSPKGLTISTREDRRALTREIVCRPAAGASRSLRVKHKPDYAEVTIRPDEDAILVGVRLNVAGGEVLAADYISLCGTSDDVELVKIPIRFLHEEWGHH